MKHATKMFFIMGPLWIFEIIEWQLKLTGNYDLNVSKGLLIFHICNSLQGFFMLCAICRNKIANFFGSIFSHLNPNSRQSFNPQSSKASKTTAMATTSV